MSKASVKEELVLRREATTRAQMALRIYTMSKCSDTIELQLTDLITDLRHLARGRRLNFGAILMESEKHFKLEAKETAERCTSTT